MTRTIGVNKASSDAEMPTSIWSGTINIWGFDLKCHVLSDGRRVVEEDSMVGFIEALGEGRLKDNPLDIEKLREWFGSGLA